MADNKEELVFAEGFFPARPNEKGPKSIKARIGIDMNKFVPFARKYVKQNGFVDIDIRWSEAKGKLYATMNTFVPKSQDDGSKGIDLSGLDSINAELAGNKETIPF